MSRRFDDETNHEVLRQKIIGLGERSIRKSYYSKLQEHVAELERFRALLDQTTDAIFLLRAPKGRVVDANESACGQLGMNKDELLELAAEHIWPNEVVPIIRDLFSSPSSSPSPKTVEIDIAIGNDRRFPAEITLRRVRFRDADYVVAVSRDVSARKQAEEKYRSIFENAVEGIFQITPDGTFVSANPALAGILGYESPHELMMTIGTSGAPLFIDPAGHDRLIAAAESGSAVTGFETRWYRKDGSTLRVSLNARPITDEQGRMTLLEGFVQDVTERKAVEEALKQSGERYRILVENSPIGIASYDLDGKILDLNTAMPSIMGSPSLEATKRINVFTLPQLVEGGLSDAMRRCVTNGETIVDEFPYTSKWNKDLHVRLHLAPIRDSEGNVAAGQVLVEDITERRRLEEQVSQSAKMEAIGRLAGGVAHDFNNLLTAMLGYSEMLLGQMPVDSPFRDRVALIQQAAERASELTGQLLAFSRKQILDLRPVSLNDAVSQFEKMLRRLIGENINLEVKTDPYARHVTADPGRVEQILMNLAVNARDAMPHGGSLTIESQNVYLDEAYARNNPEVVPGPYVMLAVSDTGAGMDDATVSRIFEPFFTTKDQPGGTGLGLATVYGIVKQHKGHIAVYSEPGKGTTFKVYLPSIEDRAPTVKSIETPLAPYPGKETVLLVEDEDMVRDMTAEALKNLGYYVLGARDGEAGLSLAEEHEGSIDLLLTDVVLPHMDGKSLFEQLSARRPGIRVLYMSGYAENFIVRHGVLQPDVHFLQKPFTVDALGIKIREALS
jgi:PAS domain S-box-containing protein